MDTSVDTSNLPSFVNNDLDSAAKSASSPSQYAVQLSPQSSPLTTSPPAIERETRTEEELEPNSQSVSNALIHPRVDLPVNDGPEDHVSFQTSTSDQSKAEMNEIAHGDIFNLPPRTLSLSPDEIEAKYVTTNPSQESFVPLDMSHTLLDKSNCQQESYVCRNEENRSQSNECSDEVTQNETGTQSPISPSSQQRFNLNQHQQQESLQESPSSDQTRQETSLHPKDHTFESANGEGSSNMHASSSLEMDQQSLKSSPTGRSAGDETYVKQKSTEHMHVDDDDVKCGEVESLDTSMLQERYTSYTINAQEGSSRASSVNPTGKDDERQSDEYMHDHSEKASHQSNFCREEDMVKGEMIVDQETEECNSSLHECPEQTQVQSDDFHSMELVSSVENRSPVNCNDNQICDDLRNGRQNFTTMTNDMNEISQLNDVQIDILSNITDRQNNAHQHQAHHYNSQQPEQFHIHNDRDGNHLFHYQQLQPRQFYMQSMDQHQQNSHHEMESSQQRQFQHNFQMHAYHHHHQPIQHHHHHHHVDERQPHQMTSIDDLMMDEDHDIDNTNRFKMLSPIVKNENQDDGYETSAGDILTPKSHTSSSSTSSSSQHPLTPRQAHHPGQSNLAASTIASPLHMHHSNSGLIPKLEAPTPQPSNSSVEDPFNYMEDEMNNNVHIVSPGMGSNSMSLRQQVYAHHNISTSVGEVGNCDVDDNNMTSMMNNGLLVPLGNSGKLGQDDVGQIINGSPANPITSLDSALIPELTPAKKRGRKKKIRDENGTIVNGLKPAPVQKERKKHDRFNGMPEEEVSKRTLPDHLTDNLDIIIIGINPGLFAAYKGHHYAGPGNHFWKCLYLSGLIHEQMTAEEDYKLLDFGIGFTNMVERATKGSADLTRKEIKEGCRILLDKLRKFRPKIAVFNGKLIFEVFSGKKDFHFGRQDDFVDGTNTYMWVMPSSSARCAQLPRAADKVPFYAALKKFRDYLNGLIPHIEDSECVFNDPKYKACCETEPKTEKLIYRDITEVSNCNLADASNNKSISLMISKNGQAGVDSDMKILDSSILNSDFMAPPGKKKRGRPKKIKGVDCSSNNLNNSNSPAEHNQSCLHKSSTVSLHMAQPNGNFNASSLADCKILNSGMTPKKKRGRPKKIKTAVTMSNNSNTCTELIMNNRNADGQLLNNSNPNSGLSGDRLETVEISHNNSGNSMVSPAGEMDSIHGNNTCGNTLSHSRLYSSLMHSPSTVSGSYCSFGINITAPPSSSPMNFNPNTNTNSYHHQHPHQIVQHGHHSLLHHHNPYQSTYGAHSDLPSEISAAISAEHLSDSPASASPGLGSSYDSPSIHSNETNTNEMRYSSPTTIHDHHQRKHLQLLGGTYPNYNSSPDNYMSPVHSGNPHNNVNEIGGNDRYLSAHQSNHANENQQQQQQNNDVSSKSLSGLESLVHQIPTMSDASNTSVQQQLSNQSSPPAGQMPSNNSHPISDPSSDHASLNGDQYSSNCLYNEYSSPAQHRNGSSMSPASPIVSAAASASSVMHLSPHQHYSNAIGSYSPGCIASNSVASSIVSPSSASPSPLSTTVANNGTNCNNGAPNAFNYSGLVASNFSVSSLTSSIVPNAYRANLMSTSSPSSSSHHQLNASNAGSSSGSASNSPMYMEQPQMLLPVSPLYHPHHHNPYAQHSVYSGYGGAPPPLPSAIATSASSSLSPVQSPVLQQLHPPANSHTTIHMPSPNYPYGYSNTGGYPQVHHPHHPAVHHHHHQTVHHPAAVHHPATAASYLSTHSTMFDRLKSDFGYGGF